jgi:signal transduction histidine kinase
VVAAGLSSPRARPTDALEAPWPLMIHLRELADRRPTLVDIATVIGLDALTAVPLIGTENRWWVWVLDQLLVLPLMTRRRHPFAVFVIVSAVAFGQWLSDVPLAADAALLAALYTVAAHESRARAAIAALVLEVGVVLASIRFAPAGENLVYSLVFLTGLVVAATFVGFTLRTRRAYLASVVERSRQLEIDREHEATLAVSRERTRIAREMHDIVAHGLSVIISLADGAALLAPSEPEQAAEVMTTVSATGRESLGEMRRLLGVLRDDQTADLAPQPSFAQIDELIERVRLVGLTVDVAVAGQPRQLPQTEDATAYRIAQECLTNVVKHGRNVSKVDVCVTWTRDCLRLVVSDDGDAHPRQLAGHGLMGMTERAGIFGGHVIAGPRGERGWRVEATLPIGLS